ALREELRLAYVAFTRARQLLVTSGHWWGRTQKKPRGPSEYLQVVHRWLREQGREADVWTPDPLADDAASANPLLAQRAAVGWPRPVDPDLVERRRAVADEVRADLEGAGSAGENGSAGAVGGVPSEESGAARADLDQVVPAGEVEAREVERLRALDA